MATDNDSTVPRHHVNITERTYQALDEYRERDGEWTESWDTFFRRVLREKKLSK